MSIIIGLCAVLGAVWFIFDSLAAREAANEAAAARCARDNLQFLDGTVAFHDWASLAWAAVSRCGASSGSSSALTVTRDWAVS